MHFISLVSLLLVAVPASSLSLPNLGKLPEYAGTIRIEGENKTLYNGPFGFDLSNVTTKSGGTHHCDGTYTNIRGKPGSTATMALNSIARTRFGWDG
jgi:hypothetical protein